ncbi:hypothetical protein C8J56DRAFT_1170406 [Mycena floridula]|nr:hypothetical protein C8J56DRAFT_1170406 [Mycena floridula]
MAIPNNLNDLNLPQISVQQEQEVTVLLQALNSSTDPFTDTGQYPLPVLIHAAVQIIDQYDYLAPNSTALVARRYLWAFVLVSREPVHPSKSSARAAQRRFIVKEIFNKRNELWYQHLALGVLVEDTLAITKTPSVVGSNASAQGQKRRSESVKKKVRRRERYMCKLSGALESVESDASGQELDAEREAEDTNDEEMQDDVREEQFEQFDIDKEDDDDDEEDPEPVESDGSGMDVDIELKNNVRMSLEVAHGVPWNPRDEVRFNSSSHSACRSCIWQYKVLVRAVFGITLRSHPDLPTNALYLGHIFYSIFSQFLISFQWSKQKKALVMVIRPEKRERALEHLKGLIANITGQTSESLEGRALLPSQPDCGVPDPDPYWFNLHQAIGDIYWMAGGAEPRGFEDEDDKEEILQKVSEDSISLVMAKLSVFEMVQQRRQHQNNNQSLLSLDTKYESQMLK